MLRSGYSSESVLAELQTRHALEPLDSAARKSMLGFGASAQLVAALGSAAFTVSSSEADRARGREAEVATRRQAQIEQDQKLGTLYQARQAQSRTQAGLRSPRARRAFSTP